MLRQMGEGHMNGYDDSDPWLGHCFVVVGSIPDVGTEKEMFLMFKCVTKSERLIKGCKDVLALSWDAGPRGDGVCWITPQKPTGRCCVSRLDPQLPIAFLPPV